MTQEHKDLLLKDLCARLPYKIKCEVIRRCIDGEMVYIRNGSTALELTINNIKELATDNLYEIKPYLFPLSSMTEEQMEELEELCDMYTPDDDYDPWGYWGIKVLYKHVLDDNYKFDFKIDVIDWFHKNHFDYRGLIPMGLAIDATGLNIY